MLSVNLGDSLPHLRRRLSPMKFSFRMHVLIVGLLFAQAISACTPQRLAMPTQEPPSATPLNVSLPGTEVRQLKSSATGRDYDIYVRLPEEYAQDRAKKYPVLYVLDGQWDFKLLDSIYGGLHYDGFVPEMIIVGITYSGENADYSSLRAMDYTPVHQIFVPGSGDAPKFLSFLKEQLIPFVEKEYRADASRRVLM